MAAAGSSAARRVEAAVEGDAGDAFQAFWAKYDGSGGAYLPATAQACRQLAAACDQYADAVHTAKRRLEELAAEIGATLVVGTALAFFTFGISEGAAAAATAALVASAEAIGVEVSATVASIVGSALTYAAFGAVEGAAVDVAVAQPIRVQMFHDGGYSLHEPAFAALTGGVTGGVLGGTGRSIAAIRALGKASTASNEIEAEAELAFRSEVSHIFRKASGHFSDDTPQNRALISDAVDAQNLRITRTLPDGSVLRKYFKILPDGQQVWAEVRDGTTITNGGINVVPRR